MKEMFDTAYDMMQEKFIAVKDVKETNNIFDLGYQGITIEKFVEKLKSNNITRLIDIRERPVSRKSGFGKNQFRNKLKELKITYKHIPELGSPYELRQELRDNWDYEAFFKEYSLHVAKHQDKLSELIHFISEGNTAILCFESDYQKCHRKIIIDLLENLDIDITHI